MPLAVAGLVGEGDQPRLTALASLVEATAKVVPLSPPHGLGRRNGGTIKGRGIIERQRAGRHILNRPKYETSQDRRRRRCLGCRTQGVARDRAYC